jgi:hypothetical protein
MSLRAVLGGAAIVAAVGVGAVILAPGIIRASRPTLLKALTQGMALARVGRARIESVWEDLEDFVAEASAAMEAQAKAAAAATTPDAANPSPAETAAANDGQSAAQACGPAANAV